ncbi:MAG TPA: hypothetical protein VHX86_02675 [Tepidisphaeraceae bacterium]|jgi:hypothetical protein|nr:hypothetical protein [Tepidisphaeraceae bacterium]
MRRLSFYLEHLEPRVLFGGTSSIELASQPPTENPAITSDPGPTVITPAAASPATVTVTTTSLSVTANDQGGAGNLSYIWSVLSKPSGAMTPTFSVNGNNSASNTIATFYSAGSYQFEATITDSAGLSTTSVVSVQVSQTLSGIDISPPATMTTSSTQQLAATAYDQFGIAMAAQPTITWSASSGSFSGSGLYHSSSSSGTPTISASSGGISGSTVISVVKSPAILASPSTVTGTSTTLTVVGAGGGLLSSSSWSVTSKPSGAKTPNLDVGSSGTSAIVTFFQAGTYAFQFESGSLLGLLGSTSETISVTVAQTLTSISVTPTSVSLNENGSRQFTATGYDQFGKAMAVQPAFGWAVTSGGGNFSGTAGNYVAPDAPTTATVAAIYGSMIGSATVTVINAAPTVAVSAQATPNPITDTFADLSVLGADDGGESNLTYTWSVTAKPAGALNPSFSLNSSNAAKDTVATFSAAGTYELLATITDSGGLSTTSSVTVVVDQTLTSISVSPTSAAVTISATQQFTATGLDQFGQRMAVQPTFDWSTTSGAPVDSTGLYTAPGSTGADTVIASSGSVSGSADITIVSSGTAVASPSNVTGTTTNLSVLGGATTGVTYTWSVTSAPIGVTDPTFSVNSSSAAQTTTATFFDVGDYTFQVAIDNGTVTDETVAVTVVQALASIVVTPGAVNLNENGQQQFTAAGYDQFGDTMSLQPAFAWVVSSGNGAIDGNGLYAAAGSGGTGPATITATSDGVFGDASIAVTNAAPTAAAPAVATPTPVTGTSTQLGVLGADDGGESNLVYTWSTTGSTPAPVIFSANGDNASKNVTATFTAAGEYDFLVTIVDAEGASIASSVTVHVVPTLSTIAVTPADSSIERSASEQFSATGLDQFGAALASQPVFTWSTLDSIGSVDSNGLYSAPDAGIGNATIIARSEGQSGSATVVLVQLTAVASGPATGSTSGAPASSNSGANSGIAAILNQPSNSTGGATLTASPSSGGTYVNVFSDAPIVGLTASPAVDDTPTAAPTPAPTPMPTGNFGQRNSSSSATGKPAPTPSATATAVAATKPPTPAADVPDERVETVPDQVFRFLAPQSPMLNNLDTVKSEMASQTSLKVAAGSATVVSFGASAAYFIWLLRGGSLLSSLLSIFPAWKSMDPLPVLDSFENSRKRKKRRSASEAESLESLVDRSNQSAENVNGINDGNAA